VKHVLSGQDFGWQRIVGRGLPGGKFLFLSRQEKKPKEGDPNIPALRLPDSQACQAGGEELAPHLLDV
jgi:hypothetical protein